jgi:hypothetical protein
MLVGLVASSFLAQSSIHADEFDVLAAYREAGSLNDQWQACAASFAKGRLRSAMTPELLAGEALDRCRATEDRLSRFLALKIGRKSTKGVMTFLRDKYRSGLAAAISELRTRG